jgi:predicted Fe-Mo cluster-binding NifX family protein
MTAIMKIAVASQNRKSVTGHAGKCRKFWIYDIEARAVKEKNLLELPREQSFHEHHGAEPHPLHGVQVLITGGMGEGLVRRLATMDIAGFVTSETDPDLAVAAYLAGTLPLGQPEVHGEPAHPHGNHHV